MPKRALIEHRPWLLAAIAGAIAYFFLRSGGVDELPIILLKGSGAAFLAIYALARCKLFDARLLAAVMAFSSVGDMAIELSFVWGGAAFALSHALAITLYLRNRRGQTTGSQKGAAFALFLITPMVSWLLTRDTAVTAYAITLGAMAATAWLSRFSRYRVGLGAILFVISDWLIFLNVGAEGAHGITSLLIWPLYFSGQFLIATGVIQTLRRELPAAA